MTSRTSTPENERKSGTETARLPTPSELDSWPGLQDAMDRVLAAKKAESSKGSQSQTSAPPSNGP
jgi:hypothetical protein